MSRHVDADALLAALYEADAITPRGAKIIREFPAVDAVEARQGCWKPHSKVEYPVYHCSACGGQALFAWGKQCKSDYCPNCGAKMNLVTDCNQVKDGDGE